MAIKDSILANGSAHTVPTTVKYWLDLEHGGTKEFYPGTAGSYRREHNPQPVQVTDVTGHEKDFDLDKHGFAYIKHDTVEKDFADDDTIKARVYPEAIDLLKGV
jgi:hypothetical protein